jgi:hypothetical protein
MTSRQITARETRNDEQGHMMTETTSTHEVPRSLMAFLREGRGGSARSKASAATGGKKQIWGPRRVIALLMIILIPLVGFLGAGAAQADGKDDDVMKYSFYKIASSTTAFFSTVQDPSSETGFNPSWAPVIANAGAAGSLLGYADPDFSTVSGWLASKLSGSSDAIGYETLLVRDSTVDQGGYSGSKYQGMVDYAYFGAALKGMGLDGTSTGLSLGFMSMATGGVVMMLYILGGAVDFIFDSFVSLLSMLNPFKLFYAGVSAISPELANGMVGDGDPAVGALSGLVSWIGGWYQVLNSLSWTVLVPIFITVLLFSLFMFKKMDRGGAIKKIVIRLLFIGLGLPLLGSMYTGMIDSMADASSSGNAGSTRVVMSTYVDFENWAMNSRLAIPAGANIAWNAGSGQPSGAAQSDVRNTALAINNQTHGLGLTSIVSSGAYDATFAKQIMEGKTKDASTSANVYGTTVDMLARFMGNSQISAASFETRAKGDLTQSVYYSSHANGTVKDWFEKLQKDAKGLNADDANPAANPLVAVPAGQGLQASGTGTRKFSSSVSGCNYTGTSIATYDGKPRPCNLSPLSMYNYLNTDFGSTSMTMYSSSNVASEATRSIHNSVNQVGTGTMSFLYWFNAVVLLGSFVLIGLGYAFSLLFSSIRRSFQIVTAVPFATLGALAAIAKVVVYTAALIFEVIITIFVYKLVQEFLTSLPQIIEMPFAAILNNGTSGPLAGFVTFLTSGWAFSLVVTLLSIIGVLIFTVLALRIRKVLVKAVEETVTKLVEKFMDTQVGMPGGGGAVPALAGGLAAGAGAAAANRMMSGGMNKGPAGSLLPGTGGTGGPEGVTTAGGTTDVGPGPTGGADGQLEITGGGTGAIGNGDPGTTPDGSAPGGARGDSITEEVALGREIESSGLSKPGEIQAPRVGDDAMSAGSDSVEKAAAGYKAADAKQLEVGKEGAQATGHAALAVGRGFAGDGVGAAESGGKAIQHGGAAAAAGHKAQQADSDAGRSSLDKSNQKHSQKAAQAQQVSKLGGTVAGVAGAANGASSGAVASAKGAAPVTGKSTASATGTKPSAAPTVRPAQPAKTVQAPKAPTPTVQSPRSPQAPKQQQAPRAPKPPTQPQRPVKQAPQRSTPRPVQAAPKAGRKEDPTKS